MIDLQFEQYRECKLDGFNLVDSYPVQQWTHYVARFSGADLPEQLLEPEALIIANDTGEVLQIVLREEGCDSPMFQFTETEKKQITAWFDEEISRKK
ncbi:hypothetical protein M3202_07765 [Alkalihalobacillus oceani]|uniref:Uncharacterized protein n=1 Tax=Halalkalibacter oceani TaxID=1653776 RepID=A0A9X2DQI1_9BACI|nr:hypothetical protein [Halalkalibacter oceani]MCM3713980.1 hypothetical protein [Halalkalibacter oceani]